MEFVVDVIDATDNALCLRLPNSSLWKCEFSDGDGYVFAILKLLKFRDKFFSPFIR